MILDIRFYASDLCHRGGFHHSCSFPMLAAGRVDDLASLKTIENNSSRLRRFRHYVILRAEMNRLKLDRYYPDLGLYTTLAPS